MPSSCHSNRLFSLLRNTERKVSKFTAQTDTHLRNRMQMSLYDGNISYYLAVSLSSPGSRMPLPTIRALSLRPTVLVTTLFSSLLKIYIEEKNDTWWHGQNSKSTHKIEFHIHYTWKIIDWFCSITVRNVMDFEIIDLCSNPGCLDLLDVYSFVN